MLRHRIHRALACLAIVAASAFSARQAHAQGSIGVATSMTVQQFMQELSNYGTWTPNQTWGWVWQPRGVLPGWRPYSQGQWLVAEGYGMYWQSYEPFGWAVYHYGRWTWWDGTGWVWIPDKTWGPGWVNWAYGEGYIAWTPMPPQAPGNLGVVNGTCSNPAWAWMIVPQASFLTSNVFQWAIPTPRNTNILPSMQQHTLYSGVSDFSLPKEMVLAVSGSADPAQPVLFVMTPIGVPRGDEQGAINAYAPVLTGAAQPLAQHFAIAPPTPPHAPPPPSAPKPPLPPTWRPVAPSQGMTEQQAEARQQQLLDVYRRGNAQRLALAQSFDPYAPPISGWSMDNAPQWKQNEANELQAQNQREEALVRGGAYGGSPYAAPQQPSSFATRPGAVPTQPPPNDRPPNVNDVAPPPNQRPNGG
jgi:hypothetical protein